MSNALTTNPPLNVAINQILLPHILIYVFSFLLAEPRIFPPAKGDTRTSLLLVCRYWNQLVLGAPQFWSSYNVFPTPLNNAQALVSLFHTFVLRSASLPLDFYFQTDFHRAHRHTFFDLLVNDQIPGAGTVSAVGLILPYVDRLRDLSIVLSLRGSFNFFYFIPIHSLRSLRNISLTLVNDIGDPLSSITITDSTPFASLDDIWKAAGVLASGQAQIIHVPLSWWAITKLSLGGYHISLNIFMRIMRLSKRSLSEAYFWIRLNSHSEHRLRARFKKPFTAAYLRKLRLRIVDAGYYLDFVDKIRAPSMVDLQIDHAARNLPRYCDIRVYGKWLKRGKHSLETLVLSDVLFEGQSPSIIWQRSCPGQTSYSDLVKFLRALPKVRSLTVPAGIYFDSRVLDSIACGELLSEVTGFNIGTDSDPLKFLNMVRDRNTGSSSSNKVPIRRLSLTLPSSMLVIKWQLESEAGSVPQLDHCQFYFA